MSEKRKIGVYGIVPIALLQDEKVKPNMLKVYAALASFQGGGDNCWPSVAAIADRAGMKSDAVSNATDRLAEVGWVRKTRRANERKTNVYEVLVDVDDTGSEQENPDTGETPNSEKFRKRANSEKFRKPSSSEKNIEKNSSHREIVDLYFSLHEQSMGARPQFGKEHGGALRNLLKKYEPDIVKKKLRGYYGQEYWFTRDGRDWWGFVKHFDAIQIQRDNQPDTRRVCSECGKKDPNSTSGSCMFCGGAFVE